MINKIFKQVWNERKENAWLFVELVIVAFFLWYAIDPLYQLIGVLNIPQGFNDDNVCRLYVATYSKHSKMYDATAACGDEAEEAAIENMTKSIISLPEVDKYSTGIASPYSESQLFSDFCTMQNDEFGETMNFHCVDACGGNILDVFQIKEIDSGKILPALEKGEFYLSRSAAMKIYGTTDCVGRVLSKGITHKLGTVKGVVEDIKLTPYDLPRSFVVSSLTASSGFIFLRLKEGVDKHAFIKRFNEEIAPTLRVGNYYPSTLRDYSELSNEIFEHQGNTSKYRFLQFLSFFAAFCAFLGIVSTFWIRTNDRRGDLGVMRSVGATKKRIVGQFVTEALLLVTVAFAVALPLIFYFYSVTGFSQPLENVGEEELVQFSVMFSPVVRFSLITLAAYLLIALTAVLAAVIPAVRACNVQIATALHEE